MENAALERPFLADCPTRLVVEIISEKWAVLVLFGLARGPLRHGELVDRIGGVSRKMLTQTLRRLEAYGLVERRVEPGRRISYRLTELGATLIDPIESLTEWARRHADEVLDSAPAEAPPWVGES